MSYQPKPLGVEDVARALLDPSAPVTDPMLKLLQVAMSGFGYNFYDARNVARANDQLVRGRAGDVLGMASSTLDRLQKAYMDGAFPGSTREQPFPPAEVMHVARAIESLRKRALALSSAIVAAETPATDSIWFRFRDERSVLDALVAYDVALIRGADTVASSAEALDAGACDDAALTGLDAELRRLEHLFSARRDLLRGGSPPAPGTTIVTI